MQETPLLTPEEIANRLRVLPGWAVAGGELTKTYVVRSFAHGAIFISAIAQLAEAANHHPDLRLHAYRHVEVRLSNHRAGGITALDFMVAGQIEALPHKPPVAKTVV